MAQNLKKFTLKIKKITLIPQNSKFLYNALPLMNVDSFIIINKSKYLFYPASILNSQLHSLTGSSI